jgi:hypothetical protein
LFIEHRRFILVHRFIAEAFLTVDIVPSGTPGLDYLMQRISLRENIIA